MKTIKPKEEKIKRVVIDVKRSATQNAMQANLASFIKAAIPESKITAKMIQQNSNRYYKSKIAKFRKVTKDNIQYVRFNAELFGYESVQTVLALDNVGYVYVANLDTLAAIFNAKEREEKQIIAKMLGKDSIQKLRGGEAIRLKLTKVKASWYLTDKESILADFEKCKTDMEDVSHIYVPKAYLANLYKNEDVQVYLLRDNGAKNDINIELQTVTVIQCPTRKAYLEFTFHLGSKNMFIRMYIHKVSRRVMSYYEVTHAAKIEAKIEDINLEDLE